MLRFLTVLCLFVSLASGNNFNSQEGIKQFTQDAYMNPNLGVNPDGSVFPPLAQHPQVELGVPPQVAQIPVSPFGRRMLIVPAPIYGRPPMHVMNSPTVIGTPVYEMNSPMMSPMMSTMNSPMMSTMNSPMMSTMMTPMMSTMNSPMMSPMMSTMNSPMMSPMMSTMMSPMNSMMPDPLFNVVYNPHLYPYVEQPIYTTEPVYTQFMPQTMMNSPMMGPNQHPMMSSPMMGPNNFIDSSAYVSPPFVESTIVGSQAMPPQVYGSPIIGQPVMAPFIRPPILATTLNGQPVLLDEEESPKANK